MKKEDITIGMKVVPVDKMVFSDLNHCYTFKERMKINQPFLYVMDFNHDEFDFEVVELSVDNDREHYCVDYYMFEDFEPYVE